MLLGRPWLHTANIKQHWQRNMISFRRGKTKVRIITEEQVTTPHNTSPLYAEGVHMLDGLADDEVDDFLEDHPTIIPLFEIDAIPTIGTPVDEEVTKEKLPQDESDPTTNAELCHARDVFERKLAILNANTPPTVPEPVAAEVSSLEGKPPPTALEPVAPEDNSRGDTTPPAPTTQPPSPTPQPDHLAHTPDPDNILDILEEE